MTTRQFSIKKGDRLPTLEATLKYADGGVIDLTGATVKLIMAATPGSTPKVATAGVVTNAAGGVVQYLWAAGDTDTAGRYVAEFEVTANGKTLTVPNDSYFEVHVTGDLG